MTSTTTSVGSNSNPSTYGDLVTLTATITAGGAGPSITGSVLFFAGNIALGEGLFAAGHPTATATLNVSRLLVGAHSITATYSGDANYSPSHSTALTQTVNKLTPSFLQGTPATIVHGEVVSLTATLTTPGKVVPVAPSGIVTFYDDTTVLGTASVAFSGTGTAVASLAGVTLGVGSHTTLYSSYGGDANFNSANSSADSRTVSKSDTTTVVASSVNPSALNQSTTFTAVVAPASPGSGVPTGTVTFTIDSVPGSPISLADGVAIYSTSSLTQTTHTVSAAYNGDADFSTSASGDLTQTVNAAVNWVLSASAAAPDPIQGTMLTAGLARLSPLTGSLNRSIAFCADQHSACDCGCGCQDDSSLAGKDPLAFSFNSNTVNVKPIVLARLASDFGGAVPSLIEARLTWNGTDQDWVSFATTGHSAGDVYALPLQVASAVNSSGIYAWSARVRATVGGTVHDSTVSGVLPVIVNTASPFGAGWSLAGTRALLIGSAGVAIVDNATGGFRYFTGTPGTLPYTYTSPDNDQGTLVKNDDGVNVYSYTAKNQVQTHFNSSGQQISQVDPHDLAQTLTYSDGKLSTIAQPDGGVATFAYSGDLLAGVALPGSRRFQFEHDENDNLVAVIDPSGNRHAFAYDGSHRLVNDRVGPLNATCNYSSTNGTITSVDRGLGTITSLTAAAVQGLGAAVAINQSDAVAEVTDGLGHATSHALDALGRTTKVVSADGGVQSWVLNAAGNPTLYTDALGNWTEYTYDSAQDMTQVRYADDTTTDYEYHATFHTVTRIEDANANVTEMTYDGDTGDLLTVTDALLNVTTYTWADGLKQTMVDALDRETAYTWNADKRRLLSVTDALGNVTGFGYDAAGNRISTLDALGRLTGVTFDGNRRELTRTDALGGVTSFEWDAVGNLLETIDPLGRVARNEFDRRSLLVRTTEVAGTPLERTTGNQYDAAGNLVGTTNALGVSTRFEYDDDNRRIATIEAAGTCAERRVEVEYDVAGNPIQSTDARGMVTRLEYDARHRPVIRIEAYGTALARTTLTAYDDVGNVASVTDPLGVVTEFEYDALNRETVKTEAAGTALERSSETAYDEVGNVASATNPLSVVTEFEYDDLNRRTQTTEAAGTGVERVMSQAYDAVSNVVSTTNARGVVTRTSYDALNRPVLRVQDYGGDRQRALATTYDGAGNIASVANPLGVLTRFAHDELNRRIAVTEAAGTDLERTRRTEYDLADNVIATIDALGVATRFGHDALGRRVSVFYADGGAAMTVYDAGDHVVQLIDPLGNATSNEFDALGRMTVTTDALGGETALVYDLADNLLSLTDAVGNATRWAYDALRRRTAELDAAGNSAFWEYNAVNLPAATTDKLGREIDNTFDDLNRLTGTTGFGGTGTIDFTWDPNDNPLTGGNDMGTITNTFDALDRLASAADAFGNELTFGWDAADNRTLVADSFGGEARRLFDALNRPTSIRFGGSGQTPLREDRAYTPRDEVSRRTRYGDLAGTTPVGMSNMRYDNMGRPTLWQHQTGCGIDIFHFHSANAFDINNRITAETLDDGAPTNYQYDFTNQLINDGRQSYTFDLNGNRTMPGYTTGVNNQITSDGTWNYYADRAGNIVQRTKIGTGAIWQYAFDNRNRMTSARHTTDAGVQVDASYSYDAFGRRVQKIVTTGAGTTTTRFAYDDSQQIWADTDGDDALTMRYLLGDGALERLARIDDAGEASWLLQDRLGSVRNVTDADGEVIDTIDYDGFGVITEQTSAEDGGDYLFAGYRRDAETNFYRPDPSAGRVYAPAIGRWWSVDPIGFAGGDTNLWRYVGNDGVNWTDALGLSESPHRDLLDAALRAGLRSCLGLCSPGVDAPPNLAAAIAIALMRLSIGLGGPASDWSGRRNAIAMLNVALGLGGPGRKLTVSPIKWSLITLEEGLDTWRPFVRQFHQQICIETSAGKRCFSFGLDIPKWLLFGPSIHVGGRWLGRESTTCSIIPGFQGVVYRTAPVPFAKPIRVKHATQEEADAFYFKLVEMEGNRGAYSFLRHSCRDFSQMLFDEAPGHIVIIPLPVRQVLGMPQPPQHDNLSGGFGGSRPHYLPCFTKPVNSMAPPPYLPVERNQAFPRQNW